MADFFDDVKKINDYNVIKIFEGAVNEYSNLVFLVEKNKIKYVLKIIFEDKEIIDDEYEILSFKNDCSSVIVCVVDRGSFFMGREYYYYLVMEYVEGYTIKKYIEICRKKNIKINEKCFIKLIYHIIKGIDYLHSHGIVHGDLNSGNIIFNKSQLKIIDLGLSCILKKNVKSSISCLKYLKTSYGAGKSDEELFELVMKDDIYDIHNLIDEFPDKIKDKNMKKISSECGNSNYKKRPTTKQLLKELEKEYPFLK